MRTSILPDLIHEQRKIVDGGDVHVVRLDGHIRIDESTYVGRRWTWRPSAGVTSTCQQRRPLY